MDVNTLFEIKAYAFYRMTHIMAPGKDDVLSDCSDEKRLQAWDEWNKTYKDIITAMIAAFNYICNP